jgi:CheY-like chemotaxis protein
MAVTPELQRAAAADGCATILVVEDEVLIRMVLTHHLRSRGYRVLEASDGTEAMQILRSDQAIDLLLTDVGLPGGITGFEIARRAKHRRPELAVIITSGTDPSLQSGADLRDEHPYVRKPYDPDALVAEIRRLLRAAER